MYPDVSRNSHYLLKWSWKNHNVPRSHAILRWYFIMFQNVSGNSLMFLNGLQVSTMSPDVLRNLHNVHQCDLLVQESLNLSKDFIHASLSLNRLRLALLGIVVDNRLCEVVERGESLLDSLLIVVDAA